jgi:DNA-binding transcriptional LysR family regulator
MDAYPDLTLDLHLSDAQFNLIAGSYDIALRNSVLEDSSLTARKLADDQRILCASPDYLERFGTPKHPDDLKEHRLIGFRDFDPTELVSSKRIASEFAPKRAKQRLLVNDGMTQKKATLEGAGVSINSLWLVHEELRSGKLIQVLPDHAVAHQPSLWLIYPKSNVVSAKVRVLIDFLVKEIGSQPPWMSSAKPY